MSDPLKRENKKNREKVAKWCKDVRQILKLRSDSWLKKKLDKKVSTGDSHELHETWSRFEDRIKELEKSDSLFASRWMKEAADILQTFEADKTRDQARVISLQLKELDARLAVKTAAPGADGEALDALAKVRETCAADMETVLANAFGAAEQKLSALRFHDQEPPHQFSPALVELIISARSLIRVEQPGRVLKELAKVDQVVAAAKDRAKLFRDSRDRLNDATEEWWDLADQPAGISPEAFREGKQKLETAKEAFGDGDYELVVTTLSGLDEMIKPLRKAMSSEDKAEFDKLRKAREKFAETVAEADKTLASLAARRELDSSDVSSVFDELIARAEFDVRGMKTAQEVTARTKQLTDALDKVREDAKKTSEAIKKKCDEDLKDRPKWELESRRCEETLAAVLQLPGAGEEAEQLRQRLASARACIQFDQRLDPASGELLSWGYSDALERLPDYESIHKAAAKKNAELLAAGMPPELTAVVIAIEAALAELELVAPTVWSEIQRDEFDESLGEIRAALAAASDIGRARTDALAKLESLRARFVDDVAKRQAERTRAETAQLRAIESLYQLQMKGVPPTQFAVEARGLQETQAGDLPEREWARAAECFEAIASAANDRLAKFEQYAADWTSAKRVLDNASALAPTLLKWPPAASAANSLLEGVRGVRQVMTDTADLEAALRAFAQARIDQQYDGLLAIATKVPDPADQTEIHAQFAAAGNSLRDACNKAHSGVLRKLEKKLKDLIDPRATELHQTLGTIEGAWDGFRQEFFADLKDAAQFDREEWLSKITVQSAEHHAQVAIVMNRAQNLLDNDQELARFESDAKQAEARTLGPRPDAKFEKLFDTLKLLGAPDVEVSAARQEFDQIMVDNAKSIVQSYLNIFSVSPLKSDNPAPRMDKMMADFRSAYALLGEMRTSANRMLEHSVTTNVTNTGDIKKVQKDWVARASHLTKTLRESAAAIRDVVGRVKSLPEDEALPADELAQFETDVASAANLVEKLAVRFRADLFHTSFHALSTGESDDRKRAREDLLRKMREVRVQVLENPLFTKLRSDRNPFGGDKIMAALAYVRSSLKRIELAALLGA